ncbi:hypothetical protein [Streptomyces sp. wa22]|uniref:hypothetical protein n=1 Tax=Streptomyces sp. wa22 TaxID=1828244 RepID=UPI0016503D88|nr:hypothetical protein [Streptomyces sp. wa22]
MRQRIVRLALVGGVLFLALLLLTATVSSFGKRDGSGGRQASPLQPARPVAVSRVRSR